MVLGTVKNGIKAFNIILLGNWWEDELGQKFSTISRRNPTHSHMASLYLHIKGCGQITSHYFTYKGRGQMTSLHLSGVVLKSIRNTEFLYSGRNKIQKRHYFFWVMLLSRLDIKVTGSSSSSSLSVSQRNNSFNPWWWATCDEMKAKHFQLEKDESFLRVFNFQFGIVILWWVATISCHQELEQLFPWSLFMFNENQVPEWLTITSTYPIILSFRSCTYNVEIHNPVDLYTLWVLWLWWYVCPSPLNL